MEPQIQHAMTSDGVNIAYDARRWRTPRSAKLPSMTAVTNRQLFSRALPAAGILIAAAMVASFLVLPDSARATVITVTTEADELNANGDCSLREAITAANTDLAEGACPAGSGDDVIELPAGTYKITRAGALDD